jgi:hypothetical protein
MLGPAHLPRHVKSEVESLCDLNDRVLAGLGDSDLLSGGERRVILVVNLVQPAQREKDMV